jgi:hypothetical protein
MEHDNLSGVGSVMITSSALTRPPPSTKGESRLVSLVTMSLSKGNAAVLRHEQLERLGLRAGTHVRVVAAVAAVAAEPAARLAGSLPEFPDLNWEDFERATELARRALTST